MLTIAVGDLCVPKRSREMPSSGGRILLVPSDVEDAAAKLGLSMAQVCRKAGVAPSTFSRWKAGLTSPTLDICHRWLAVVEPNQ
jgi:predicted transcriptional regulator